MPTIRRSGFTLIELLIVITIVWILVFMATNVDFNKKTSVEKGMRITEKVRSIFQSVKMQVSSGRGVTSGGKLINPTSTEIVISTGSVTVKYFSGATQVGTGESLSYPFFGDKSYTIRSVYQYTDKALTTTGGLTAPARIILESDRDMSFSGSDTGIDASYMIGLSLGYEKQLHAIEIDRRTGRISTK